MKKFLSMLAAFVCLFNLRAQDDTVEKMIREGITQIDASLKTWDKNEILSAKAAFEKAVMVAPQNTHALYWKAYADYRLAILSLYVRQRDENAGKQYIDESIKTLEQVIEFNDADVESYALLGSLTGMKIQFNPLSGMWLGPKSQGYFEKALTLTKENPRVYYLMGIGTLHTPAMFGGGPKKAIPQLDQAIQLFEQEGLSKVGDLLTPTWGLDECYSTLGNAYEKMDDLDKAKAHYLKALEINPNSRRAQSELAKIAKN